jgi:6-pyruvoyltetrahydropterin/6-carboxytetrahydropterin synthase
MRMASAYLTRRISFAAAHRYRRPEWTDSKNVEVFGACAWPNFHGHSYQCEVTVRGMIDDVTGFAVDLGTLDEILRVEVWERFDHRNLNLDIPDFADGKMIPTSENLARMIFDLVAPKLPDGVQLAEVAISEDQTMRVAYRND